MTEALTDWMLWLRLRLRVADWVAANKRLGVVGRGDVSGRAGGGVVECGGEVRLAVGVAVDG